MLEERFTPRLRGVLKQQERDEAELLDRFSVPHAPDVVQTGKTVVEVLRREFGVDFSGTAFVEAGSTSPDVVQVPSPFTSSR